MRYIFYVLLAANIGYFSYQWFYATELVNKSRPTSQSMSNIVLLREVNPNDRASEMAEVVSNPIRVNTSDAQTCFGIGPFDDVFSGQNALDQLAALDVTAELKAMDSATGERDFRVYIPPAASAEEAFRMLRELQASEIDSYVITQGDQALGISLGVFSANEAAITVQNQLKEMGYEPEILGIERLARTYWIYPPLESQAAANWLQNQPNLEMKATNCIEG